MADLVIERLEVSYGGVRAVRGIDLRVDAGQLVALVGPNGAGKSSIARAIAGLVTASGSLRVGGVEMLGKPAHLRAPHRLGFVPEGRELFGPLSARENLLLGGYCTSPRRRAAGIDRVCELFPALGPRLEQMASSLSGGEQQMLAVGRALMLEPEILVLDEPSMGLSPLIAHTLFTALRTVADAGMAVLVGDQNARRALTVADHAYVLRLGQVAASGPPEQFASAAVLAGDYFGGNTSATPDEVPVSGSP